MTANDIGFIMAVFGASDAVFSIIVGKLSDVLGQLPMVYVSRTFVHT